jgi:hypothetical protein
VAAARDGVHMVAGAFDNAGPDAPVAGVVTAAPGAGLG